MYNKGRYNECLHPVVNRPASYCDISCSSLVRVSSYPASRFINSPQSLKAYVVIDNSELSDHDHLTDRSICRLIRSNHL